jgi:hypothetical protein
LEIRVKRLLVLIALAMSVLAGSAGAETNGFDYNRWLSTVARESLWQSASEDARVPRGVVRRVSVRCYRNRRSFEEAFQERSRVTANRVIAYYAGGRDVHLRRGTCNNVRLFAEGVHTLFTTGAFSVLLHEALHRQGLVNERLTTCFANESVRWGARWLGFSEGQALRARNLAFAYTRLYAPHDYRMGKPNCLALARRAEWVDIT